MKNYRIAKSSKKLKARSQKLKDVLLAGIKRESKSAADVMEECDKM